MKSANLLDSITSFLSLVLIIISSLCAHYFIDIEYVQAVLLITIFFNALRIFRHQSHRFIPITLTLLGILLLLSIHFNLITKGFTLGFIALIIFSLAGLRQWYKHQNKELQILSNISNISQILTLLFIPFYMSLGYQIVNTIKQSPPLTGIKIGLINLQQEASITNPEAQKLYQQAKEVSYEGKADEAFHLLSEALGKEPSNAYLQSQMSQQYVFRADTTKALEHITNAINLSNKSYYIQQRSWIHYNLHQYEEAISDIHLLQQLDPRNTWAQLLSAYIANENRNFEAACKHADSASMFCSNYTLKQDINYFIENNCGPNRFFNLIKPYETDYLSHSIAYFYKKYTTDENGEPDMDNGIPPKGNFTRQEIKQHIVRNQGFFRGQEMDFIYLYEKGTNVLIVIRRTKCNLSKKTLKYIFIEPDIFENFELRII
ncbi:hypothetical protein KDU71_06720 [Carboxylicivirga sediminis]|uniref:Tetratricopeptide repeat protein n=1 Tax=Carboxylicivirga sediminis TaxID=2006564 RepID=A0A941IVP1_9BACT|nr:hypothetical protein [Carboxylicivirga sediminis]MBR8535246.1 hypothetical protein [Carboxylicivirga sediminis]